MFLHTKNFKLLSLILGTFIGVSSFASPSIYPTGVTRYDPTKAYNSYVLFAGQDKKTHLIDLNGNRLIKNSSPKGVSTINTSALKNGIYFIKIITNTAGVQVEKIIKS